MPKLLRLDKYLDVSYPIFFNCRNSTECDQIQEKHFFGLGGKCDEITMLNRHACAAPGGQISCDVVVVVVVVVVVGM